ncbi:Pol [Symbiodinium natans]|uniref:Pol protein n=1 Tax=Symbiodinium natans TaxID=878477 RepID=A0A812RAM5_9DINO|nr:Pol [Symbiodinium natans]
MEGTAPSSSAPLVAELVTGVRKRALRRAIGRAARNSDHTTMYKGRRCTLQALRGVNSGSPLRPAPRSRARACDRHKGPRLSAVTWNVGGLSQDAWLEVQIWLHEQVTYDIVFLQETHWRFASSWSLPRYHVFHSGATDHRFQGCMILVRKTLASFESIRWSSPLNGHVLQVKLPVAHRHVDLINVYQYAFHTGPDKAAVLHKRERVIYHLDKLLSSLPIRNTLLMGGDFNTTATRDARAFGPGAFIGKHPHPDRHLLANLVGTHRLTALNTWIRLSTAFTYEHDQARSHIDFFFGREAQIDGLARRARPDHAFHLLCWRDGARHYPVGASMPAIHYQTTSKQTDSCQTRTPRYQLAQPQACVAAFQQSLSQHLSAPVTPEGLDTALQQAATHLVPIKPPLKHASVAERVTGTVKQMWNLRHTAQQYAIEVLRPFTIVAQIRHWCYTGERLWFSLAHLFTAWRHQADYLRQHRHLRRQGKRAKKELLEDQLQQAWEADRQGDKSAIWQVIRRLAPKTAKVRVQLRGAKGELLTAEEETQRFKAYCESIYHAPATPQHLAQMLLWHLGQAIVLPHLAELCTALWLRPDEFHPLWADAWIAWLPKPGKAPDQPENLRPISLTEGGGRITLKERRATGRKPTDCIGGVTLSIDTSKAFDTVDRCVLEQELHAAHISEPELEVILHLHKCIGYWPAGQRPDTRVASERGVRQGCPLAPSLWTLVTIALLRAVANASSLDWIQNDATMFADDLLLQWEFSDVPTLNRMVNNIADCFHILAQLGLQVQHRKTQLIVAHKGRRAQQWWRAHTASTSEGRYLLIPQSQGKALKLPIVDQLTYLGIVLSDKDATTATVEHRLQVAEAQRARLLKILHSLSLPLAKRVQLWIACVRSSALYGLRLVALQQKHIERITVVLVKHLRAIARSFAHMTKEPSRALLERLGVEDPLMFLTRCGQRALAKARDSRDPMVARPRILSWLVHCTESKLALTSHLDHVPPPNYEITCSSGLEHTQAVEETLRVAALPGPLQGVNAAAVRGHSKEPSADAPPPLITEPNKESTPCLDPPDLKLPDWIKFARRSDTQAVLRQFCALCGQWLVSPRPVPSHHLEHLAPYRQRIVCSLPAMMDDFQTELDSEEKTIFGEVLGKRRLLQLDGEAPDREAKFAHPGGKGPQQGRMQRHQPPPMGRGGHQSAPAQGSRTKGHQDGRGHRDHRPGSSQTSFDDHALLHRVAKAIVVQSDYLARLQSDHTVLFTFKNGNGPQLMVPLLHEVAANWREQRSKGAVTKSLKQTLLQYVAAEIVTRVTTFGGDKAAQAKAQEMGWITSDMEYNFLDWNAEEQRLVPRQEGTLTQDQVLAEARRLKALLKAPELVLKFAAARNARPGSTSETATFVLELSTQAPGAAEAMAIFRKWFASSALLLLSLRLKPARPEKSPLIKEIQEAVGW